MKLKHGEPCSSIERRWARRGGTESDDGREKAKSNKKKLIVVVDVVPLASLWSCLLILQSPYHVIYTWKILLTSYRKIPSLFSRTNTLLCVSTCMPKTNELELLLSICRMAQSLHPSSCPWGPRQRSKVSILDSWYDLYPFL